MQCSNEIIPLLLPFSCRTLRASTDHSSPFPSMSCASCWSTSSALSLPSSHGHGAGSPVHHIHRRRNLVIPRNAVPSLLRFGLKEKTQRLGGTRGVRCDSAESSVVDHPSGMEGLRAVAQEGGRELQDETDFASIANGDGEISICGFGSLLSEKSALYTFPNLRNFRVGVLRDFRRVFGHVAPVFLDRGIANLDTKELSSLSVEPCVGESIVVTVFEISVAEVPAFIEREHEFRFLAVTVEDRDGQPFSQQAVICSRYSDEEYRRTRCQGSSEEYHRRYGKHNIQQIWRDDIFPCRVYLRHCVLAAKNLGLDAYDSFLDHTFLGDRTTTIRRYFETSLGVGVMDELPPEALRERYGG